MGKTILSVRDLHTAYKTRSGGFVHAVDGVSFDLEEGKTLGIAGESGCGKSTLALSLMGFYFPPLTFLGGNIVMDGVDLMKLLYEELRVNYLGRRIAYIPQAAMNALNPTMRVLRFALDVMREHDPSKTLNDAEALLRERFRVLGLPERAMRAYPNELSGGMKQRTVIVLSSLLNPDILIADEPTSALDVTSQKKVMQMMKNMRELGIVKSIIYITHELPLLRHITNDIMVMYAGEIVEKAATEKVVFDPLHPYSKALMSSIIVPEPGAKGWKVTAIPGTPPNLKTRFTTCRFAERCRFAGALCQERKGGAQWLEDEGRFYRCDLAERTLREVYADE